MKVGSLLFVAATVFSTADARAGDDKKDSLTVLPWTEASLVFSTADKNGVVAYTHFWDPYILYVKASAPIDDDTRIGQFTSDGHLAGGFAGTIQLGFDQRATELAHLERRYREVADALKGMSAPPPRLELRKAFVTKHKLRNNNDELVRFFCHTEQGHACPELTLPREVCKALGKPCDVAADAATAGNAAHATAIEIAASPACASLTSASPELDRCFTASWWIGVEGYETATHQVLAYADDQQTIDVTWKVFENADAKKAKELLDKAGGNKAQALLDSREEVERAFKVILHKTALERRDLLLTGILADAQQDAFAITVDAHIGYDRQDVYQDDLAAKAVSNSKYDSTIGLNFTAYPAATTGLALNVRAGYERDRDPGAKKVERCTTRPSTDTTVSGKSCKADALFRAGDAAAAESSGYLRIAATYQYEGETSDDDLVPGVELRGALEGLGGDKSATTRVTLFGTPIKGSAAARVGVALDLAYRIDTGGDGASRWTITPMFFVGASFSDLMSSK